MNPRVKTTSAARRALAVATILGWAAGPLPPAFAASAQTADAIYVGGDVVTIDDAQPTAGALAVRDGKMLFVRSRVDAESCHGYGYDDTVMPNGRLLDRERLMMRAQ